MRLELEKKQKKSDKQNTLHTYDGRLRLRESDEEGSVVDSVGMNTRLINYNPANNILYPTTTMQTSSSVTMNSMDGHQIATTNSHYSSNDLDDTSRNCGVSSITETPLDLHYAFRNDYTVDPTQSSYSLMYSNANFFSNNATASFVDFNAMGISNQSSLIPSYSNYSTTIPYNGLMNTVQTSTAHTTNDGISSCSNYITSGANDCLQNGALFDNHVTEDFLNINQSATSNSKEIKTSIDQLSGKYNDYVNDSSKLLDVTSVSSVDLNSLLSDENLTGHQLDAVPSTNGSDTIQSVSTESLGFMRFESDYANKLNASHNYSLSNESSATDVTDDKTNDLFQKDSVHTT